MSYQGIMLFGKKIPVPECHTPVPECHIPATSQIGCCEIQTNSAIKNACRNNINQTGAENSDESKNSSDLRDTKKEPPHNVHENESKANTDEDKVLKKPDKILHCPRCNSLETKFCYFNNYNVNQPRHFCRNCQRYWTAGGTMRNVPIGAGRRKNKHIASQYQHVILASDGIVAANVEHEHERISTLQCNGNVLKFGQDSSHGPLNDSMVNLINHKRSFDHGEEEVSLCGSSVTNGSTQGIELSKNNRSKQPLQFSPFHPMMFPMNPNWNNVASMVQSSMNMNMCNNYRTDVAAMPWGLAPKIPIQFVHGSYYHGNGTVSIGSNGCISPSSSTSNSCCSGNGTTTTTLGKHTRDSVLIDEEKSEMCVFVPKTLRID